METTNRACRWVSRRLPLLAGGELAGIDRRRVERHLIACPACRDELAGASRSVALLQGFGAATCRAGEDSPSLWPDLARQIRESRHGVRPRAPWAWSTLPAAGRPGLRVALGLAAAAGFALAVGVLAPSGAPRSDRADRPVVRVDPPTEAVGIGVTSPAVVAGHLDPPIPSASSRSGDLPLPLVQANRLPSALPDGQPAYDPRGVDPFQAPLPLRLDFDLDRGTLPGSGAQDTQRAY